MRKFYRDSNDDMPEEFLRQKLAEIERYQFTIALPACFINDFIAAFKKLKKSYKSITMPIFLHEKEGFCKLSSKWGAKVPVELQTLVDSMNQRMHKRLSVPKVEFLFKGQFYTFCTSGAEGDNVDPFEGLVNTFIQKNLLIYHSLDHTIDKLVEITGMEFEKINYTRRSEEDIEAMRP